MYDEINIKENLFMMFYFLYIKSKYDYLFLGKISGGI